MNLRAHSPFLKSSINRVGEMIVKTLWSLAVLCQTLVSVCGNEVFVKNLKNAKELVSVSIMNISNIWEIEKYPKFLKSCQMHKSSWIEMKLRFMSIIVSSSLHREKQHEDFEKNFVISFTGSSVTAGHDSRFDQAYPRVTYDFMNPAFTALDINLDVRNVAHGNNPCFPYDPCVGTIAGLDADIVHWEQSYNCFDLPMYEQFARQASFSHKKPIVVYSESHTAKWKEEECKDKPAKTTFTSEEENLLKLYAGINNDKEASIENLISEVNKDEMKRAVRRFVCLVLLYLLCVQWYCLFLRLCFVELEVGFIYLSVYDIYSGEC